MTWESRYLILPEDGIGSIPREAPRGRKRGGQEQSLPASLLFNRSSTRLITAVTCMAVIAIADYAWIGGNDNAERTVKEVASRPTPLPGDAVIEPAPVFQPPPPPAKIEKVETVGRGDTLMIVLRRGGASRRDAHNAIAALRKVFNPRRLNRKQEIRIFLQPESRIDTTGRLVGFSFDPSVERSIQVLLDGEDYRAEAHQRILDAQDAVVSGKIEHSLYVAAVKAGLTPNVLVELIRLYSWDVDFQRDIQPGDGFTVLTERLHFKDGRIAKWGDILHAELVLSGKPVRIYRYETKKHGVEYFDEKGRSAQKALMKTPIDGARLSSGFGRRKHPILGYTRMHKGIDFAAPRGTPIYAAGNGTVVYSGRKGGFGKYVKIRHNDTYETAYAHMNGYARGIRQGARVRQGQVIGYVGSTGRSTGPHLHYEIHRNGQQVNPLRIKLPSGRKLAGAELKRFAEIKSDIDTKLAAMPGVARHADSR